jgi:hypothetical protein
MDERERREEDTGRKRLASDGTDEGSRDEHVIHRHQQNGGKQPLTSREREERWPIG